MEGLATLITSRFSTATHHMKAVNNDVSLQELLADTSLCIHSAQPQNKQFKSSSLHFSTRSNTHEQCILSIMAHVYRNVGFKLPFPQICQNKIAQMAPFWPKFREISDRANTKRTHPPALFSLA